MSISIDFSRAMYNHHRQEAKCPPVIAIRLKPAHWGWYVEMKDGSCSIDSVPASEVSDMWEAKCKCIETWQRKQALKGQGDHDGH